jgi:D-threonate/D-erythronate kinase
VLGGLPVEVVDGETTEDVTAAARAIAADQPLPLAAGPAALAGALAECLCLPRSASPEPGPRLGACLLVNGSLHPASAAQVDYALAHGWLSVQPAGAPGVLAKGRGCVLDTGSAVAGEGLVRAAAVGEAVRDILDGSPGATLMVCGGDTAFAIHRALGAPDFAPLREVLPGVPLARCAGRTWITKAGGFGLPPIVCDIQRLLT